MASHGPMIRTLMRTASLPRLRRCALLSEEVNFLWRVETGAVEMCAGLGILQFSTPIVERAGLTWGVGEPRVPVLGSVSVAVVLGLGSFFP